MLEQGTFEDVLVTLSDQGGVILITKSAVKVT